MKTQIKFTSIITLALFLSLLLFSSVTAFENYQLTAPFSPVTVASCAAQTEILALTNSGDEASQISLTFENKNVNEFAQIVPSQFFLTPGETKTITIFINAPCTTQGTFDYAIKLQGNSLSQIYDRTIQINKISNIDFIATKGNVLESCPAIPQTIPFTITNTGTWAESYTVKAIGHEENVAVPQGELFLAPGQTFSGAAFVSFSESTYGTKNFALQVTSTNSQFKATMPVTYNIAACYDYSLGITPTTSICEQDTKEIAAFINNSAAYTNTFDIKSKTPSFVNLGGNQVTLLPTQTGIVPFVISPSRGDAGKYNINVQTTSKLGKLFATQDSQVNVLRCYDYNIATQNELTKFGVCAPGEKLSFTITNNGELTQEMHVDSSDSRFTSSPSIFNLTSGANKTITLTVPSNGIEKKMSFTLNVWSTNNPNVIAQKQITLQPYDLKTCYGVEVSPEVFNINNSKTNLSIKITNQGIRNTVYNVSVDGPQWANLLEDSVYISAKSSEYVTLQTRAPLYVENNTYQVNLSIETPYSEQVEPLKLILNKQTGEVLFWFLLIILLVLIALLVILLIARNSKSSRGQPVAEEETQKATLRPLPSPKKLTAAQIAKEKAAARAQARKDKKAKIAEQEEVIKIKSQESSESSWGRLLFIILIVAVLLALLLALILNNSETNKANASNTTTLTNHTTTPVVSQNTTNASTISGSEGNNTGSMINGSNVVNNTSSNMSYNNTTISNQSQSSTSFWQALSNFFANFKIFSDNKETNVTQTNLTTNASNISVVSPINVTNQTSNTTTNVSINVTSNVTSNISVVSNNTNSNVTQNTNVSNTTTIPIKDIQREADLAAAYEVLAQASNSNRVFMLIQNTTGILNLSHYFVDPDNLSLSYEFQSVNASKTTALIFDDQMLIRPNTNFVGVQTFRIIATNKANLSTTSPLFTIAVLDESPKEPLSKSIQLGLLILLILVALIVYFDIKLIAKQYSIARSSQKNSKKRK